MNLISSTDLCVHYGSQIALLDVQFSITRGEIVTIFGPNGSGKSSLISELIGAINPASGTVTRAKGLTIG